MIRLSYSTEMLPSLANRVDLSPNLDPLGLPRPRFTFQVDQYSQDGLAEGLKTANSIFAFMGVEDVEPASLLKDGRLNWNTAAHIMGTCIMGKKAADSVVDKWGRAHDHDSLYIAGSSVFATGATANPTLTLAALTLRTVKSIHKQLRFGREPLLG